MGEGGERNEDLGDEDEQLQGMQVPSPERFLKICSNSSGQRMTHEQSIDLLVGSVLLYYKKHSEDADLESVRYGIRRVMFRTKKIQKVFHSGDGPANRILDAASETKLLRENLQEFY